MPVTAFGGSEKSAKDGPTMDMENERKGKHCAPWRIPGRGVMRLGRLERLGHGLQVAHRRHNDALLVADEPRIQVRTCPWGIALRGRFGHCLLIDN
jgi:hypothetical protein